MSEEIINTNSGIEAGKWIFTVIEEPKKIHMGKNNTTGYEFKFSAINTEGMRAEHKEKFPVFLVGPLFKALGCEEVSTGKFKFDPTNMADRVVSAEIIYEDFVNKTTGETRPYPHMKKITEEVPF